MSDKMSLIALGKAIHGGSGGGSGEMNVQSDWNETDTTSDAFIKNKPNFSTVATSGDYYDLTNKPTIPEAYTLPTASTDTLGGVKVDGTSITINKGVISATQPVMPTVDTELDPTSDNAIANSAVAEQFVNVSNDIDLIESNLVSTKTTAKADIVSISDAQDIPAEDVKADIEPVQDLHGYEYPWVGGAGKNIFDFESWLIARGVTYTKSGNAYTFNVSSLVGSSGAWTFSDTPINVTLTASINNVTSTNVGFRLKYDTDISARGDNITMTATTVYLDWSTTGQVTISDPMIRLATVTDPTYAPYSNICPISGYTECEVTRTGVNQWDEQVELGYYDSTGAYQSANNRLCTKNKIKVNPQNTYYCKLPLSSSLTDNFIICYDKNEAFLQRLNLSNSGNGFTFTTPNNCYYINVNFTASYTGGTTYNNDISINYPSTITSYQAYSGQTYTVSFVDDQDNPMTVYSGTLDITTGVLTVDKAITRRTEFDYKSSSTYNYIYRLGTINKSDITNIENTITDKFKYKSVYSVNESGFFIGMGAASSPQNELWVGLTLESGIDTLAKANTWLTNNGGYVDVLYELATPTTIQLTPTQVDMLLNNNVLSADTGKIQVKYQPANVIGELKKEIKEVDDKIPTTPFDGKKVLFIGDSFMEGFGARVADGLETTSNPITTPALADSTPMRGWAKTFQERYPKSIVHNLSIYGATIAFQNNAPSVMGQLTYIATNSIGGEYVVLDGGANDVFQGITKGSAKADDVYEEMNWDTMNYNTYQTIPCLEAIFAIFAEHFPTVRLLYVSPPPMDVTLTEEMQTAMDTMNTEIEALCEKWGVKYIKIIGKGSKNTIYSNNTEYYSASDKIHPLQRFYDETIGQIDEVLKQF